MITALAHRWRAALLVAMLAAAGSARAQSSGFGPDNPWLFSATWEAADPLGDLSSKVSDQIGFVGVAGDMRVAVGRGFSLGTALAWNRFTKGTPDVRLDAIAPRLTAHYHFSRSWVQPYLGFGVGAVYARTERRPGATREDWGFAADPQLGVLITVATELALDLHVRYQLTTVSVGAAHNLQWASAGVGFAFY